MYRSGKNLFIRSFIRSSVALTHEQQSGKRSVTPALRIQVHAGAFASRELGWYPSQS